MQGFPSVRRQRALNFALAIVTILSVLVAGGQAGPAFAQAGGPGQGGGPAVPPGLLNHQQFRLQHQKDFLAEHSDASGKARPDLWQLGIQETKQMKIVAGIPAPSGGAQGPAQTPGLAAPTAGGLVGVQWTQVGPAPLRVDAEQIYQGSGPDSGEVVDIAVDPRNTSDQVIFIATNDGGVWKSTDGGTTWAPKTDYMTSLSMGALALDPGNPSVVYAGTGNLFDGGGVFSKGVGIYKSVDDGETWSVVGATLFKNVGINRIVMPAANVLLVASANGVFRSVDGGLNFGNNAPSFNNSLPIIGGFISDMKLDTANPTTTVYAAVRGSGVFQSTDAGVTFPTNLFGASNGAPTANFSFIAFAQAAAPNNTRLFALVQNTGAANPPNAALYRSTDGGANWAAMSPGVSAISAENNGCQCGYDQTLGVDPQDQNRVYVGFQELYLSTDGGANFGSPGVSRNKIHWDHHAFMFTPSTHFGGGGAPTRFYVGEDGGIATSGDGGNNFSNLNEGIATNLFLGIDIGRGSSANNAYTTGGTQDTGSPSRRPGMTGADWHLGIDGDGGPATIDPTNPQNQYGSDDGTFIVSTDGGATWDFNNRGLPGGGLVLVDPNNGANVYVSNGTQLFRSTSTASNGSFTSIANFTSGITSLSMVALDSNTMYVGLANGTVQTTGNVLSGSPPTWTSHNVTGAPNKAVTGLAIDPTNTGTAVAVYPGFSGINPANRTKHVFQTTDNGATWSDISGTDGGDSTQNLPDLPLHSVVIDAGVSPHAIIVASDAAVMRSANNGASWQVLGVGLPTVDSKSLALDASANPPLLRIGTYGRSVFELTSASGPLIAVNANLAFGTVPLGSSVTLPVQVFNVGSSDLHISSFTRVSGSDEFALLTSPGTPVTVPAGGEIDFSVRFTPKTAGNEAATFQINSDDPFRPAYQLFASGTGGGPQIAVSGDLNFGTVARGTTASRPVTVQNTGTGPLTVTGVFFQFGSDPAFSVLPNPGTPQTIQPSDSVIFTVQFAPPANADSTPRTGTLEVDSQDTANPPNALPAQTLPASGTPGTPQLKLASSSLTFDSRAVDDRTVPNTSDQTLSITNQSSCSLCDVTISSLPITGPNAGDFTLISPPALPLKLGAGNSVNLTIRFNPSDAGARTATLTINSDDPVLPSQAVSLAGTGLMPAILPSPSPMIFGPTVYDPVCSGSCGQTQNETITNIGQAELILDQLTFSGDPSFSGPGPTDPLTRVQPTLSFSETVTFHPMTAPSRKLTGNLHIADLMGPSPTAAAVAADVPLCGESVGRGIRVLVFDTSGQVPKVTKFSLQSHGTTIPINVQLKNQALTTINPPTSCQTIQFHYENQNLPAADNTVPRGSYYTVSVSVGNKKNTTSFTLGVNEFKILKLTVQ